MFVISALCEQTKYAFKMATPIWISVANCSCVICVKQTNHIMCLDKLADFLTVSQGAKNINTGHVAMQSIRIH